MDNSRDEIRERNAGNKKDINVIRRKIRASLNGDNRDILAEIKNNEKELPEKENDLGGESCSGDSKIFDHSEFNRRSEEKELLV